MGGETVAAQEINNAAPICEVDRSLHKFINISKFIFISGLTRRGRAPCGRRRAAARRRFLSMLMFGEKASSFIILIYNFVTWVPVDKV